MHTLIVGPRHVGKTTLISRVLEEIKLPVFGFETKKEDSLAQEPHGSPIYIYDAKQERFQTPENLVGYCKDNHASTIKDAFDRYAVKLSGPVPGGHLILLDELGFMESASPDFCQAVLNLLDGDIPVIAAVKDKTTPFLEAVRSHKNAKCFYIDLGNRDELFPEVLSFVKAQLAGKEL